MQSNNTRSKDMNEEIETYVKNILASIEDWEEDNSLVNAKKLNLQLTVLKLMVRPSEFDELSAFARYLRQTSKAIEADEKRTEVNYEK